MTFLICVMVLEFHRNESHALYPLETTVDKHIVSPRCSLDGLEIAALTGCFQSLRATFMLPCAKIASSVYFQALP